MSFKSAAFLFWTVIAGLLLARVALHDQIALDSSSAGQLLAWLRTVIG